MPVGTPSPRSPHYPRGRVAPRPTLRERAGCLLWATICVGALAGAAWWMLQKPATTPVAQDPPSPTRDAGSALNTTSATPTTVLAPSDSPTVTPAPVVEASCPLFTGPRPAPVSPLLISSSWYEGADGYARARRDHEPQRAPTLLYFFTDWCPHCRRFERELLTAPAVEQFLRDQVVKVRVNPETNADDRGLAEQFDVHAFPRLLLLVGGEQARRVATHVTRNGEATLRSPEEFVAEIERLLTRWADDELRAARSEWQRGEAAAALARLDALIALRPGVLAAHTERALANSEMNATDAALDDLRRAAEIDAGQIVIFDVLDRVLARQQRWACGNLVPTLLARVIELHPDSAHARLARGGAHSRRGDRLRALADAREACRLGEPRACELLRRLEG
jgi:thiol-disulfide isomerase/thioredoxin